MYYMLPAKYQVQNVQSHSTGEQSLWHKVEMATRHIILLVASKQYGQF